MLNLILGLLPLALAVPTPYPRGGTRVPVPSKRSFTRADGTVDGLRFLTHFNNTLAKYSDRRLPSLPARTLAHRADEALTDDIDTGEDISYFGPGTVGATSPQGFTFIFDTGSSDTFVPGPSCSTDAGCSGTTRYDQEGTSVGNMTSVTYGSGMVEGNNYIDDLTVAGLTATGQGIVSLTTAEGFSGQPSDSLLGMGFSTIAQSGFPTFFENLIAQNQVTTPEFSFYLGRSQSNTQSQSELTLGGRDSSKFTGTFTQVPVTEPGYWQVALDGVTVGSTSAGPTTAGQAAIDTGTTLIIAPTIAAAAIFALIPGSIPIPQGAETLFAYPCDTTTIPAITFAGQSFSINPLDFNFGSVDLELAEMVRSRRLAHELENAAGGLCLAGIAAADLDPTENLYVVGDTFLKSWYSVYNYVDAGGSPSVSFAKAVGN